MTKLSYKVVSANNEVIATDIKTFDEAIAIKSANKGSRLVSCYTSIESERNIFLSPKKRVMRVKATV